MNKLILIGNGFDLAHGMKTNYTDFILWYLNKVYKSALNNPNYSFEDDLIKVNLDARIRNDEIKTISEFLKNTFCIKYVFKLQFSKNLISISANFKWVDIEYMYYSHLLLIYQKFENNNFDNRESISLELIKLNNCFESIKNELIEYLIDIDSCNKSIDEKIKNHIYEKISIRASNNSLTLCLNFNYTSTIDLYTPPFSPRDLEVIYIHGKLNDKHNPIIFGYGDEMDVYYEKLERLNTNEFLKNIKSFSYFKTSNYQKFSRFIDSGSFEVYIMGHSCGISDRILLNSIFEHDNCRKIQIYYHQICTNKNDYFEKTQDISRHFKASSKGQMRKIITPLTECSPLS